MGRKKEEVDADANTTEGGIRGTEEGGGGITRVLMVATPALNKGATKVDKGTTTRPAEAVGASTSTESGNP